MNIKQEASIKPMSPNQQDPQRSPNKLFTVLKVVALVFGILFLLGVVPRIFNQYELKRMKEKTSGAIPVVHTIIAKPAPFTESGVLPGNIGAIQYTTIYSRVDGYLLKRFVDIGDFVKTGQLLAVIDTPTIDQELAQAKADLAEAKSQLAAARANLKEAQAKAVASHEQVVRTKVNETYAKVTATRWKNMAAKGAVSLQSRDEKVSSYDAETATVKAAEAEEKAALSAVNSAESQVGVAKAMVVAKDASVKRLEAQQAFKNVIAPFDGVITYRKVDPGALITAGSQSSNLELFQLAKIDTLRIYVNAPQTIARYLKAGQEAVVVVTEFPERTFLGKISNIAGALDPETRTRQTEVRVDNSDHVLLPGMYAQVKITTERPTPWIRIAGTALVARSDGMYVVVVQPGYKAHYQQVAIGRDFGDEVEIQRGLNNNDVVVVSPPVDLREGEQVQPQPLTAS